MSEFYILVVPRSTKATDNIVEVDVSLDKHYPSTIERASGEMVKLMQYLIIGAVPYISLSRLYLDLK